jgi:hypothetical protein
LKSLLNDAAVSGIPGINIQWPWSRLLLSGRKSIETRSYPLPEKYTNTWLALIETPGPNGKANGVGAARIVGAIIFNESFEYRSARAWREDFRRHLVQPNDRNFSYSRTNTKWGWIVESVISFSEPKSAPARKGIVFTKCCFLARVQGNA